MYLAIVGEAAATGVIGPEPLLEKMGVEYCFVSVGFLPAVCPSEGRGAGVGLALTGFILPHTITYDAYSFSCELRLRVYAGLSPPPVDIAALCGLPLPPSPCPDSMCAPVPNSPFPL